MAEQGKNSNTFSLNSGESLLIDGEILVPIKYSSKSKPGKTISQTRLQISVVAPKTINVQRQTTKEI